METVQKIAKWFFSLKGIGIVILIALMVMIYDMFSGIDEYHTKQELIDNYNKRRNEIYEVKKYFQTIVPKNRKVEIEFESNKKLSRFGVYSINDALSKDSTQVYFLEWNLKTTSEKVDSVITSLGWTQTTLKILKAKLDDANCIQIESGEPTIIGFHRSGMGMYFYNLFEKPISKDLWKIYNDSCNHLIYNEELALEYEGGVLGAQCFPDK